MARPKAIIRTLAVLLSTLTVLCLFGDVKAGNLEYFGTPRGLYLSKSTGFLDTSGHWAEISIARVSAMGIMQGDGSRFFPQRSVSREEALATLARLARFDPSRAAGKRGSGAANLRASTWAVPYLELALQMGLLDRNESSVDFKAPALRQEVFAWTAKALKLSPQSTGDALFFEDSGDIEKQKLPYIAALAKKGIIGGWGGKLYPLNSMTRAELAALVDRIKGEEAFKLTVFRGIINSIEKTGALELAFSVKTEDGPVYDIKVTQGLTDFPVLKNKKRYASGILKKGDYIEVLAKESEVLYAEVANYSARKISGQLSMIGEGQLYIKDEGGNTVILELPEFPEVFVDGRKARLSDLLPGIEVTAWAINGKASRIEAAVTSETFSPVYEDQEAALDFPLEGTVKEIEEDSGIYKVTVSTGDGEKKISISYMDTILKNGLKVSPASLELGDKVAVYLDNKEKSLRVEVAKGGKISRIVKGKIAGQAGEEYLLVSDVKDFYYGVFKDAQDMLKVRFRGAEAFYERKSIDIGKLAAEYKGKDVYLALTDEGGISRAVKAVVKSGDEYLDNGFIEKVRWSTGEISVGELEMLMDEGTIAIVGSSSARPEYLKEDGGVFVVANKSSSGSRAALIYQPRFLEPELKVVKGQIYDIEKDSVILRYRSELEESLWSSERKSSESLEFYDDAVIIDATASSPKAISRDELLWDRYEEKFFGKSAYILLEAGKVRAMVIKEGTRSDDVISLGTFAGFTSEGYVKLEDMLDFNQFSEKWNRSLKSLELNKAGAIILEGARPINFDDLEKGQVLYVIRENNNCLLAFIQK